MMARRTLLLLLALLGLAGCPLPPPPADLEDLRLMLAGDVVAQADARAPEPVAEARALFAEADAAWQARDLDLAARLARLGQAQVRLAVARARVALAGERLEQSRTVRAEAEAEYARVEARRLELERRLADIWAWRRSAEDLARERARAVEEEALRVERLPEADRAAWETTWRARAREDLADARRTLRLAELLGAAAEYPEIHRMAAETLDTAAASTDVSPWRILRPLVDQGSLQADELRFRMLALAPGGAGASADRLRALADTYRRAFDPPFQVRADPRGVVLTMDVRAAEIEVAFPEIVGRAFDDLRARWTADPELRCLLAVRSLDPNCGDGCAERTLAWGRTVGDRLGSGAADRTEVMGWGYLPPPGAGTRVPPAGSLRLEILLFPAPAPQATSDL